MMYEELAKSLRTTVMLYGAVGQENLVTTQLMKQAADAIEERDRYALTLQHEMMSEAESHIALVERLNKQIEELQKQVAYWQGELVKSMCGEWLAEDEKSRWIPVTERLPPYGDRILVTDKTGVWEGYLSYSRGFMRNTGMTIKDIYDVEVTHWMPLPSTEGLNEA